MNASIRCGCLLATLLAAATVACRDEGATQQGDEADVVVGLASLRDKVAVFDDRLELDADVLAKLQSAGVLDKIDRYASASDKTAVEPVYLVGDRQSDATNPDGSVKDGTRNPAGYLRRAVSWHKGDGDVIVVQTQPASVAEALSEIEKTGFVGLKPNSIRPLGSGDDGANGSGDTDGTWHQTFGASYPVIDLSGKELWHHDLLAGGHAKVVLKTGRITLDPKVDTRLLVRSFHSIEASAVLDTTVKGELDFEATSDGAFDVFDKGTLWTKSFAAAGGVMPTTLTVEVRWECELGATGRTVANVGARAQGSLRTGAAFEDGKLQGILDRPTYEFERIGPTLTTNVNVQGACHLIAELSLRLFDSSGPHATLDLYTSLDANASQQQASGQASARVTAGVEATVDGTLEAFGIKLLKIDVPPYKSEQELFNGTITISGG